MVDRYGAIIFDLDGVLVDSEGTGFATLRAHLSTYGVDYRLEDKEPFIGINDRDHFAALKAQHGLPASVDELIAEHFATHAEFLITSRVAILRCR